MYVLRKLPVHAYSILKTVVKFIIWVILERGVVSFKVSNVKEQEVVNLDLIINVLRFTWRLKYCHLWKSAQFYGKKGGFHLPCLLLFIIAKSSWIQVAWNVKMKWKKVKKNEVKEKTILKNYLNMSDCIWTFNSMLKVWDPLQWGRRGHDEPILEFVFCF